MSRAWVVVLVVAGAGCGAWCVRLRGAAFGAKASITVCGDNRHDVEAVRSKLGDGDGGGGAVVDGGA